MCVSRILSPSRRALLLGIASASLTGSRAWADTRAVSSARARLAALETESAGRLGVAALNTAGGTRLSHRGGERFALCSTFKILAVAAILRRSAKEPALLQQRISYAPGDLVAYSPLTGQRVAVGMTVAELCGAALQYSDNTAANLLLKMLGGPAAVTGFARTIGDRAFRLDRWETALNGAVPGDPRDTSTPDAMARSLQRLVLGDALAPPQREQLQAWMRGNTTGAERIRAGVPAAWQVGDKTGSGDYGVTNDIAVIWPPDRSPVVLALYFAQHGKDARPRSEVLASATRIVVQALA